jgi:hypothetical protein
MQHIIATMPPASVIVARNPSAHLETFAFSGLELHLLPIITSVGISDCAVTVEFDSCFICIRQQVLEYKSTV